MIYDKNILIISKNFTETKLTLFYVLKNNKKVLIPLVVSTYQKRLKIYLW